MTRTTKHCTVNIYSPSATKQKISKISEIEEELERKTGWRIALELDPRSGYMRWACDKSQADTPHKRKIIEDALFKCTTAVFDKYSIALPL